MRADNHVWGVSPAADCVWSQVSGFSPTALAGKRPLMVMQAFFDDSYDDQIFVVAGQLASAEAWAGLSVEWEKLLPKFGVLSKRGRYVFKMNEMAKLPERLERVAPFYRLIEEKVAMSISAWLRIPDIRRAYDRLYSPTATLNFFDSIRTYDIVFGGLLDYLNKSKDLIRQVVQFDLPIDFYFDQQSEKHQILANWDRYVEARRADFGDMIGAAPKFEDDERFMPLQAADMWAWWVREWIEADTPEQMEMPDFGPFKAKREGHVKVDFQLTEDTLAKVLRTSLSNNAGGHEVYDRKNPGDVPIGIAHFRG